MSDLPIHNIGGITDASRIEQTKPAGDEKGGNFENVINEAINKVSQIQNDVDEAVSELASGGDITSAVLAVEKADMTFQVMVEVRNKLLSTYEQIMRMQV